MRKFLMMALAGLALTLAAPLTASAATAIPGEAIKAAADSISPTEAVRWHCRRWSGWCRGGPVVRRYFAPRRYHRRWRRW